MKGEREKEKEKERQKDGEGEREGERERCQMHLWFCVSTFCFVRTLGVSILQSVINLKKKRQITKTKLTSFEFRRLQEWL